MVCVYQTKSRKCIEGDWLARFLCNKGLKNASDEEKLNDLITKDETFTRVDVETVAAINLFVGTDIKYDEKEEVVNMCKAWDDHKKRGIQEGMQRGMQQGIQQGIQQGMQLKCTL